MKAGQPLNQQPATHVLYLLVLLAQEDLKLLKKGQENVAQAEMQCSMHLGDVVMIRRRVSQ